MLLLSYQYVTGYVAFRAEVQKSAKEGAMFKKKKSTLANFQYLSQPCSPTAWLSQGHIRIQGLGSKWSPGFSLPGYSYHHLLGIIQVWWNLMSGFLPGHGAAGRATP